LIEAFNLKAAIEYQLDNVDGAREALADMPPRDEGELDQVTLHNTALLEQNVSEGFRKLNFLLQSRISPPETLVNLLLLYCQHNYFNLAADILAENGDLTQRFLPRDEQEFLDCLIMAANPAAAEDAYKRFEELGARHLDALRKGTKAIQEARRNSRDQALVKRHLTEFEEALAKYVPVLMGQAKIFWDLENYGQVEKIFRNSAEYCSDDEAWKLNVAHVFFMQEKYKECIRYYEPFVRKQRADAGLLQVQAVVLANLCVAYVMTSANEEAEELMRLVEKEEELREN